MIPVLMQQAQRWLIWLITTCPNGKLAKDPRQARNSSRRASSTDPSTWCAFSEASASVQRLGACWTLGFALGDGFVGFDADGVRDPRTGEIDAEAWAFARALDSFTEISVSGTGIHVIATGNPLPGTDRKRFPYEIYDGGRMFVVTGAHIEGTPTTVEYRPAEIAALHTRMFGPPALLSTEGSTLPGNGERPALFNPRDSDLNAVFAPADLPRSAAHLTDEELIARACDAKNGDRFSQLWRGEHSGYPSQSEADAALAMHLAFWTGNDAQRMDRLFRVSGLYRAKWDQRRGQLTYGQLTINRAVRGSSEHYVPSAVIPSLPLEPGSAITLDLETAMMENL